MMVCKCGADVTISDEAIRTEAIVIGDVTTYLATCKACGRSGCRVWRAEGAAISDFYDQNGTIK